MSLVDHHAPAVGVTSACRALGVSRATWYRRRAKSVEASAAQRSRSHPRRLTDAERQAVVDALCSKEFQDRAPREVYAILLERGTYLCSIRTMYRILHERKAVRERRAQRDHPANAVPRCCARGPNEVWSWDITKIPGPARTHFSLYVVLDVYSRYVVDWLLAERESALLATRLIEQQIVTAGIDAGQLTVHADRGAPMTSRSMAQMLADLGVDRSHSRPRVSNDNPFSESQFKTMKYCPTWPGIFTDREHARQWVAAFMQWYNHQHRHEGIGLFTPADVYNGRHVSIDRERQRALDGAYAAHPERFVRGRPTSPDLPAEVWINRPTVATLTAETPAPTPAQLFRGAAGEFEGRPIPAPQHRQTPFHSRSDATALALCS